MLAPGTFLQSRYRIVRTLGVGGMGAVYLAQDMRLANRPVAVKELIPDPSASPAEQAQAQQQFQWEASTLASLDHPNLPRVSDHFTEGGKHYLVMDYVDGETLEDIINRTPGFPLESQVLNWAMQLCDVLTYLHSRQPPVIFRDLKPGNIMIDRSGTVKLIDFGIARLFKPGKTTDTLKMGTMGYAPPEQYAGRGQTDVRSDIYSLGATLHHLLTRRDPTQHPPFSFNTTPPRSLNPAVSPHVEATIMKALAHDRAQRFQTASEMKQSLLGKMPPGPPSPQPTVPVAPPARQPGLMQRITPFLLVAAVVLLLGTVLVMASVLIKLLQSTPTPTAVVVVPTHTPLTHMPVPPTPTPIVVTATPGPAPDTPVPPTATPIVIVVTATPVPATDTPIPPTSTPIPLPTVMPLAQADALNTQAEQLYRQDTSQSKAQAMDIWYQIVNARPAYVKGLYHLAGSYYDLGQIDLAITYAETAAAYDPFCINTCYILALAYEKKGWDSMACDQWRKIAELQYEDSPNHTNRDHIKGLKDTAQNKLGKCRS